MIYRPAYAYRLVAEQRILDHHVVAVMKIGQDEPAVKSWRRSRPMHLTAYAALVTDSRTDCGTSAATVQNMAIDHSSSHVVMAQQFLNGSNVVAGFEQVRGEAVPQV